MVKSLQVELNAEQRQELEELRDKGKKAYVVVTTNGSVCLNWCFLSPKNLYVDAPEAVRLVGPI